MMEISPQSLAGLSLAEKRMLLAELLQERANAVGRRLPALARPARALVPPPDGPPQPGVQRLLPVAHPVAARRAGVPPVLAERWSTATPACGRRSRSATASCVQRVHERAAPAPGGDRRVGVERRGAAPSASRPRPIAPSTWSAARWCACTCSCVHRMITSF